ncbi:MAG: PEP/pyruvate-binding domain-containing protein, partial [Caldilinea sp.]
MKRIRSAILLALPLDAPAATRAMVGGKGQSLARLASMGISTPPGFHVITDAYRRFVALNDLHTQIMTHVTGVTTDDPGELARPSAAIQALFAGGAMPDEVARAIRRAYADLGGDEPAVAVRSSATAEDLPTRSFAGQHE